MPETTKQYIDRIVDEMHKLQDIKRQLLQQLVECELLQDKLSQELARFLNHEK